MTKLRSRHCLLQIGRGQELPLQAGDHPEPLAHSPQRAQHAASGECNCSCVGQGARHRGCGSLALNIAKCMTFAFVLRSQVLTNHVLKLEKAVIRANQKEAEEVALRGRKKGGRSAAAKHRASVADSR